MTNLRKRAAVLGILGLALLVNACSAAQTKWSPDELDKLRSLWIGSLPPLPPDPSNEFADDPAAAALGHKLFFDTRFSSNGKVACGTCHQPDKLFQDGLPLAHGVGTTTRRTMSIVGTAYSPWFFWDGRKDSQWAQALGPMESAVEHGGNRTFYAHLIAQHYADEYQALFGALPDLTGRPLNAGPVTDAEAAANWAAMSEAERTAITRVYANMGKAIEAYERHLLPGASRFDAYVAAVLKNELVPAEAMLTQDEIAGLKLFIGKANCTNCHSGPLFTNNDFHNTGVPSVAGLAEDVGRMTGATQVSKDEFNCLSPYSDAAPDQCAELNFLVTDDEKLVRQFKPPSLRDVAERGPYMHAGQFATLEVVLHHYNTAPESPAGHSELEPLHLSEAQLAQIIAFLRTLDAPINADPQWLSTPEYPN